MTPYQRKAVSLVENGYAIFADPVRREAAHIQRLEAIPSNG